jgi:hypothetical protein
MFRVKSAIKKRTSNFFFCFRLFVFQLFGGLILHVGKAFLEFDDPLAERTHHARQAVAEQKNGDDHDNQQVGGAKSAHKNSLDKDNATILNSREPGKTNRMPPIQPDFILNAFQVEVYSLNGEMRSTGEFFCRNNRKNRHFGWRGRRFSAFIEFVPYFH